MKASEINTNEHISDHKLNFLYEVVRRELRSFAIRLTKLDEAVTLPVEGDLEQQLAELSKRFDAARRGLGLVNKLKSGFQRAAHAQRVMQNLNFIRKALSRTIAAMNSFDSAEHERSFSENEEESGTPWEGNTLASLMKTNMGGGFCEHCNCDPCECDHDSANCPACGSAKMGSEEGKPNINITIVMPSKDGGDDEVCDECGFDPCECGMGDELDGSDDEVCPECGYDPCECEFANDEDDSDENPELNDEEEEEDCPECDALEQNANR